MLLAGDVGGTKTRLGLFAPGARRPSPIVQHEYATADFASFTAILEAFTRDIERLSAPLLGPLSEPLSPPSGHPRFPVDAAALGVAGPVIGSTARLTNIAWDIAAAEITAAFGTRKVELMNDLAAIANSVEVLEDGELGVLQAGVPREDGNAAVIAAGTGLGQAYLHRLNGRLRPIASEGGHADFAARTDREIELVKMLREQHGRVEVEQVLSGPGLLNLHRLTHRGGQCEMLEDAADEPARVSQAALSGRCQQCAEALRMFVSAYGAEAGNLALRGVATAGLYVGGGIAPKILPMIRTGLFMEAFLAKAPMDHLVARIPVKVILNSDAGLLGAAVRAQEIAG
jgi:glucokinase